MDKLFFEKAKCMLVGAKPHNCSFSKKMISEYGLILKKMKTFVYIQETLRGVGVDVNWGDCGRSSTKF